MLKCYICIRHFKPSDFKKSAGKFLLKSDAIPTIFNEDSTAVDVDEDSNVLECSDAQLTNCSNKECINCKYLLRKISGLEQTEKKKSIDHSIDLQQLEQKLISSKDAYEKLTQRMNQIQEELRQEKTQNLKMKNIIEELQRKRKMSNDDALDVIA